MRKKHTSCRHFTLVELLVIMGILMVSAAIIVPVAGQVRERSKQIACVHNIRNISLGIQLFHNDYERYPHGDLRVDLQEYLGPDEETFYCPSTKESYTEYYVAREATDDSTYFLGCPVHEVVNYEPGKGTHTFRQGRVEYDGEEVPVGTVVSGGTLSFSDGSTASISGTVRVLASFRTDGGKLYTILRIFERNGKTKVTSQVTPGSRFEVVTPAAIAGVAGTRFDVETDRVQHGGKSVYITDVAVNRGKVIVESRATSSQAAEKSVLAPGMSKRQVTPRRNIQKDSSPNHRWWKGRGRGRGRKWWKLRPGKGRLPIWNP